MACSRNVLYLKYFILVFFLVSNTGCSSLVNKIAESYAIHEVKRFNLNINRVEPFINCIENTKGICHNLSPADHRADLKSSRISFFSKNYLINDNSRRLITTHINSRISKPIDSPVFDTEDDLKDISLREPKDVEKSKKNNFIQASKLSAEMAIEVLNHPVQKQLNRLHNSIKGAYQTNAYRDLGDGGERRNFQI